ncbi:MAG: nuclear transport factor 2 family protein [Rhodospirillales bacterium]|nr:nuclear transport factor 2 family protein [Rhodospirillales bacterium]
MSSDANRKVVTDFFGNVSAGDMEAATALLSDQMSWTLIGSTPASGTYKPLTSVQQDFLGPVMQRVEDGHIEMDLLETIADGDRVVALLKGKSKGQFGDYNNTYCHVFRVSGGKIVEATEFCDTVLIETALYGKKLVAA